MSRWCYAGATRSDPSRTRGRRVRRGIEDESVDCARWIVAREPGLDAAWPQHAGVRARPGHPVVIGREGDLPLGVEPEDGGVSRTALTVVATEHGWQIDNANRNGAVLHPWGLAVSLAPPHLVLDWPLIAVRVVGSDHARQHWVLLESHVRPDADPPLLPRPGAATTRSDPPKPLTSAELEALWTVFGDVLSWPPRLPAVPLQLKQAARRLGITESGVQLRLEGAQRKALALGLPRPVRLTEPDYLHVLVGAGYLTPPQLSPVEHTLQEL
jgi:hypothetical protein